MMQPTESCIECGQPTWFRFGRDEIPVCGQHWLRRLAKVRAACADDSYGRDAERTATRRALDDVRHAGSCLVAPGPAPAPGYRPGGAALGASP